MTKTEAKKLLSLFKKGYFLTLHDYGNDDVEEAIRVVKSVVYDEKEKNYYCEVEGNNEKLWMDVCMDANFPPLGVEEFRIYKQVRFEDL